MMESAITDKYGLNKGVNLNETEQLEREAQVAFALIERWGLIACVEDGEDSRGRFKIRILTPDELVGRAFAVAKLAMTTARDSGLVHLSPSLAEIELAHKEAEEARDQKRTRQ